MVRALAGDSTMTSLKDMVSQEEDGPDRKRWHEFTAATAACQERSVAPSAAISSG